MIMLTNLNYRNIIIMSIGRKGTRGPKLKHLFKFEDVKIQTRKS